MRHAKSAEFRSFIADIWKIGMPLGIAIFPKERQALICVGGLTQDGARKIRAITPPVDIRHRMLRWNKAEQMWEERDLRNLNPDFGGNRNLVKTHGVQRQHEKTGRRNESP